MYSGDDPGADQVESPSDVSGYFILPAAGWECRFLGISFVDVAVLCRAPSGAIRLRGVAGIVIEFDTEAGSKAGSLQARIEPSGACEQRHDGVPAIRWIIVEARTLCHPVARPVRAAGHRVPAVGLRPFE